MNLVREYSFECHMYKKERERKKEKWKRERGKRKRKSELFEDFIIIFTDASVF